MGVVRWHLINGHMRNVIGLWGIWVITALRKKKDAQVSLLNITKIGFPSLALGRILTDRFTSETDLHQRRFNPIWSPVRMLLLDVIVLTERCAKLFVLWNSLHFSFCVRWSSWHHANVAYLASSDSVVTHSGASGLVMPMSFIIPLSARRVLNDFTSYFLVCLD